MYMLYQALYISELNIWFSISKNSSIRSTYFAAEVLCK